MRGWQPWVWPSLKQRLAEGVLVCLGLLSAVPAAINASVRWRDQSGIEEKIRLGKAEIVRLNDQVAKLQQALALPFLVATDLQHWTKSAEASTLQVLHANQDAMQQTEMLHALDLQLLPMHMELVGTWKGWLDWFSQWPILAPGATMSSLKIQAHPQGGIGVQLGLVMPQPMAHEHQRRQGPEIAVSEHHKDIDPFDSHSWVQARQAHAQLHPSYQLRVTPELLRAREPLERFERARLRYVGQISAGSELQALVRVLDSLQTSSGEVHRVRLGAHVGQSFGRVSAISAEQLTIEELVLMATGEWQSRMVHLPLQEGRP